MLIHKCNKKIKDLKNIFVFFVIHHQNSYFYLFCVIINKKEGILMIKRSTYLFKLYAMKNNEKIKIIGGVKRGGKTTLISEFMTQLEIKGIKKEQLIYLNFEQPESQNNILNDDMEWYHALEQKLDETKNHYIFLDEISQLDHSMTIIEKLYAKTFVDLYLISSNAFFMSHLEKSPLHDSFVFIDIFPLSFQEFISGFPVQHHVPSTKYYWQSYLQSSFPHIITLQDDNDRFQYLSGIVDSILINDFMLYVSVSNVHLLKYLVQFLCQHTGHEISINKIATTLTCSKFPKVYPKMIDKYVQGLLDTFLFYKVNRYDIKTHQVVTASPKYYMADVGLQMPSRQRELKAPTFILENIVFLELKRRGYEVFFGKIGNHYIDFVAKKGDIFEYYQVSHLPINESILAKKMRPIKKLRNGYPRFLLTLDEAGVRGNYDGLKQLSVFEWLMQP